MKLTLCLILFIAGIFSTKGYCNNPQTYEVKGTIIDDLTNEPLPFANIFLKNNMFRGTVSDENGRFILKIEEPELNDTLVFSFVGYHEQQCPVKNGLNEELKIKLIPLVSSISEVTVKAKKIISEEFTIKKLEKMDIYLNPLSKADPLLAVNGMASSTTIDESANISLRGSSPAETGIFFNEVPVYDAVRFSQINGIGTFSIFNTSIVDKILIFPGNPPIEYGNSTSGLVSIYTADGLPDISSNYITLSLAAIGGFTTQKIKEKSALTVFANYQPSAIFTNLNQESMRDLKSFNTIDCGLYFIREFNNKTSLKLFSYSNTEGFEIGIRHPSYNGDFTQSKKRTFLITNLIRKVRNGEILLNNGVSFSNEKYLYGNSDLSINKNDFYASANYLHFFDKLSIKTGISLDSRKIDSEGTVPMFGYAIAPSHPAIHINDRTEVPVFEGYMYLKYNLTKKITLGSGARKNIPLELQDNYLTYQVNLSYAFTKSHSVNLSAGTYKKYNIPNEEIKNQYIIANDQLSIDYKIETGKLDLTAALFYKKAQIDNKPENVMGAEIYTKLVLTDKLKLQLSYTFIHEETKENELSYPGKYDMEYYVRSCIDYLLPAGINFSLIALIHQGELYLPVTGRTFDGFTQTYIPQYSSKEDMERLPAYRKIDLSLTRLFPIGEKMNVIVFFNCSNLLNAGNVREINHNSDYSQQFNEYYSQRTMYFGGVFNF